MKMKDRNSQLRNTLGSMATKEVAQTIQSMPKEDTVNRNGFAAYSLDDELRLLAMLNICRLDSQAYRSSNEQIVELRDLIERIALKDPYFVAQCIVYSRCKGEGMRTINHLAAALLAPFISGQEYAKRFYGAWDKKNERGGCIFRPDDMTEIKDVYNFLNPQTLSNAMKKGFASYIESMDAYLLTKYKKTVIDMANLTHPRSKVTVKGADGKMVNVLDALMRGINIVADTWETAQSEAGQEVAKAVREGKLSKEKAEQVLKEAKEDNWKSLLNDGKLGILAALRNIRNILSVSSDTEVVNKLCALLSNGTLIRKGLIMPYQIDMAYEITLMQPGSVEQRKVLEALKKGYLAAVPNLKEALPGKTLVIVDCSGSMHTACRDAKNHTSYKSSCAEKAGLIAATIALSTNADIIQFGDRANYYSYSPNEDVFRLGHDIVARDFGWTNIASAFELAADRNKKYDRIILLSDNEANRGNQVSSAYARYMRQTGANPYVYAVDLAGYGTTPLKPQGRVNYYMGYGFAMFEDIASKEFNPNQHIDKVRKIVI